MDKVFTCFDNNYFNSYGISWLASLRELGKYTGPVYAASFECLSTHIVEKLAKENFFVIDCHNKPKTRTSAFEVFSLEAGNFAYWDIDGYFLNSIESMQIENKLLFTKDSGFVAGNLNSWKTVSEYNRLNNFCGFKQDLNVHKYFPNSVDFLNSTWNHCTANRGIPADTIFVHFAGEIKNISTATRDGDISFVVKYPEIHKAWTTKFHASTAKKIILRKAKNE